MDGISERIKKLKSINLFPAELVSITFFAPSIKIAKIGRMVMIVLYRINEGD